MNKENSINGFAPVSSTPIFWKSRKRSGSSKNLNASTSFNSDNVPIEFGEVASGDEKNIQIGAENHEETSSEGKKQGEDPAIEVVLSEKRKALFEPLEPLYYINGKRPSAESLLPPPDFESANYPKGWLVGKKRKLVNVDVVESMRRIAVQEMNRKDRVIDELDGLLEEDARCLEHLQLQVVEEQSKRADVERENAVLRNQINMLMERIRETEAMDDEEGAEEP